MKSSGHPSVLRSYLLLLIAFSLTGLIFSNVFSLEPGRHEAILSLLNRIQKLDTELTTILLQLRSSQTVNYDPLNQTWATLVKDRTRLTEDKSGFSAQDQSTLSGALNTFDQRLKDKGTLIEQFKSHNAVLKNSLIYFSTLSNRAVEQLSQEPEHQAILHRLEKLQSLVVAVQLNNGNREFVDQARRTIQELSQQYPFVGKDDAIQMILIHARAITSHTTEIDDLMNQITGPSLNLGDSLEQRYVERHIIVEQKANFYRLVLILLDLALLGFAFHSYAKLRQHAFFLRSALSEVENLKKALDEHSIVSMTDVRGNITYVNEKFCQISGYEVSELLGHNHRLIKSDEHPPGLFKELWRTIARGDVWHGEIKNRKKDGGYYWVNATIVPFMNSQGKPEKYISIRTDITSLKHSEEAIFQMAYFDALTNLPNRRLLLDRLHQQVLRTARTSHWGAVMFIDIDNFKSFNDTLGHASGDRVLQEVAQRIRRSIREADILSRLGGDEFVVLLTDLDQDYVTALRESNLVATKIQRSIAEQLFLDGEIHYTSASIGVCLFNEGNTEAPELLKKADIAMYEAKRTGHSQIRYFDPETQRALEQRHQIEVDLRTAVEQETFLVHYQPQFDFQQNLIGLEALLRWQHPSLGLLGPAHFIGIAEESGLIVPIGQSTFHTALDALSVWSQEHPQLDFTLSVNVSARELYDPSFIPFIQDCLNRYPIEPSRLMIELTESVALANIEEATVIMKVIRALGILFSIDDFGTGYSSLTSLKYLPFDQLKIDKSFVSDITTNQNDAIVNGAIIAMSQSLGLEVIAEGIETRDQLKILTKLGCRCFQGYYFSKPMGFEQTKAWLSDYKTNLIKNPIDDSRA